MSFDPNTDSAKKDNYVNKYGRPKIELPRSIIFTIVLGAIVITIVVAGTTTANPTKLLRGANNTTYVNVTDGKSPGSAIKNGCCYEPAIIDKAEFIKDPDKLRATMEEYYELCGVCPVFISVYDEDWKKDGYADLGRYANNFTTYTQNSNAFVILVSVPGDKNQRQFFSYVIFQGRNAGTFMTKSVSKHFMKVIKEEGDSGANSTDIFNAAFRYAIDDANSKINPTPAERALFVLKACLPAIITIAVFLTILIVLSVKFRREIKAGNYSDNLF